MNAVTKLTHKLAGFGLGTNEPIIIAGPCSAESEAQVLATARALAATARVSAFRAGVWKPRTRPGSFEGIGKPALQWLQKAKAETGLPVLTEVANAWHVEEALKHGVDMLWIGARTTVNPFYVQEIAEALRGVDIPVLVKNPIHPDLGLWIGAIERLHAHGVSRLAAIHRGFYAFKPAPFRNEPRWDMSFELRARLPEVPIICDPSHIAGRRDLIHEVSQTALDINLDGLMIECHINPSQALSDAEQQVTPQQLHDILGELVLRQEEAEAETTALRLAGLRLNIDVIDAEILDLLHKRFDEVNEIAQIKQEDNIAIFQMSRWFELMENRKKSGSQLGLDESMLHELYSVIHKYSVKRQIEIIHRKEKS